MKTIALNCLATLVAVVIFFCLLHISEQPSQAPADQHAQDRLQRAAAALCTAELGPGTQALWTTTGDLVCRPATTITAGGAQ